MQKQAPPPEQELNLVAECVWGRVCGGVRVCASCSSGKTERCSVLSLSFISASGMCFQLQSSGRFTARKLGNRNRKLQSLTLCVCEGFCILCGLDNMQAEEEGEVWGVVEGGQRKGRRFPPIRLAL